MAFFYAAIRRQSISSLKFPFLNYVQFFSFEISSICLLKYPYSWFFSPFLFPSCCTVDPSAVLAVFSRCN